MTKPVTEPPFPLQVMKLNYQSSKRQMQLYAENHVTVQTTGKRVTTRVLGLPIPLWTIVATVNNLPIQDGRYFEEQRSIDSSMATPGAYNGKTI